MGLMCMFNSKGKSRWVCVRLRRDRMRWQPGGYAALASGVQPELFATCLLRILYYADNPRIVVYTNSGSTVALTASPTPCVGPVIQMTARPTQCPFQNMYNTASGRICKIRRTKCETVYTTSQEQNQSSMGTGVYDEQFAANREAHMEDEMKNDRHVEIIHCQ